MCYWPAALNVRSWLWSAERQCTIRLTDGVRMAACTLDLPRPPLGGVLSTQLGRQLVASHSSIPRACVAIYHSNCKRPCNHQAPYAASHLRSAFRFHTALVPLPEAFSGRCSSDLVAQATPATSPLRRPRPGPNPALDAGHMDRGGREDRRKGRRRSRSRSHEERRRRSRSPERTRRNDRGNSKDVQPRLEPAAPAAQPSPEPAAPPAAAAAPVPGPAPTAQLVAPSRDNLRQLMATRSDLDALREVERQLVGE